MRRIKFSHMIGMALLMSLLATVQAAPAFAAMLYVSVTGVRSSNGWLDLCVFDTAENFPNCRSDPAAISRRLPATAGTVRFDVNVAPGSHAVSVLHDENANGRLDTNFLGIPLEGGGTSNNPAPRMGPPRFSDALFELAHTGGHIIIKMVYP